MAEPTIINPTAIGDWLKTVEWYDNHTIQGWIDCRRLYYYHNVHEGGLAKGVGNGARFGSAIHMGLAAYYTNYQLPYDDKVAYACWAYDREYKKRFGSANPEVDDKHFIENGLSILGDYFDTFKTEDHLFRPVDAELACLYRMEQREGEPPFAPFWYVMRVDGLYEQYGSGDWFVLETKTTASGCDRELVRLAFDRQPIGYCTILSEFAEGHKIQGFLGNVILVTKIKKEAKRQFFAVTPPRMREWRLETIRHIEDIRSAKAALNMPLIGDEQVRMSYFARNTGHCTKYGMCAYYDLCNGGHWTLERTNLTGRFGLNVWHPFKSAEEDQ